MRRGGEGGRRKILQRKSEDEIYSEEIERWKKKTLYDENEDE